MLLLLRYNEMISCNAFATAVSAPPCWGDISRLLSFLFHASSVFLRVAISPAFSHSNVDSSIAVLITSCSPVSFSLSSLAVQMRSCDRLLFLPNPPRCLPPTLSFLLYDSFLQCESAHKRRQAACRENQSYNVQCIVCKMYASMCRDNAGYVYILIIHVDYIA